MSGTPLSYEIFNAREQLLSADLVRAQQLLSREIQDAAAGLARSADFPANPTTWSDPLTTVSSPISGLDALPTWTAAAGFAVTIGAGNGWLYYQTGVTADFSPFQALRWPSQSLTHATPDATNPRIDAIVVTPGTQSTDAQSRTVLVDPVTRAISTNSLNKSSNPLSTLSIVTGTPAATPLPPALAAGTAALFYVYVPAVAATSASFKPCRGLWRRTSYPFAGASGVLAGMRLYWSQVDPATTSAALFATGPGGTLDELHRVVIDGEVLDFVGSFSTAGGNVVMDTAHNPSTTVNGSATTDTPFYIYAVGGRHNPMPNISPSGTPSLNAVILACSTVAPNIQTGKPTAVLTVRGASVQDGAVYVGLGSIVRSTTGRFRSMVVMGDMTISANEALDLPAAPTTLSGGLPGTLITISGKPTFATKVFAQLQLIAATTAANRLVQVFNGSLGGLTATTSPMAAVQVIKGSDTQPIFQSATIGLLPAGTTFVVTTVNTSDTFRIEVCGYNQCVNRFDGQPS